MELTGIIQFVLLLTTQQVSIYSYDHESDHDYYFISGYCSCGKLNKKGHHITGGSVDDPREIPWNALIVAEKQNLVCGGVIINDRFILTAGHCVHKHRLQVNYYHVVVGAENYNRHHNRESHYKVVKIITHKNYGVIEPRFSNDIALLRLHRRIVFNYFIKPICLPKKNLPVEGEKAVVIGFQGGISDEDLTPVLREVPVKISLRNSCLYVTLKAPYPQPPEGDTMLCVTGSKGLEPGCTPDGGSYMIHVTSNNVAVLIGIVSIDLKCDDNKPVAFAKIPAFVDWIKEHTKDACYCRNVS